MIKLLLLVIVIIDLLYDRYMDYRVWKQRSKSLPKEVADIYGEERYQKFISYKKEYRRVNLINLIFNLGVTFIILFTPFLSVVDKLSDNVYMVMIYTMLILEVIGGIRGFVSSYYKTFYIEEKYGLNKKTKKEFLKDFFLFEIFGFGITVVFGMLVVFLVEKLMLYCQTVNFTEALLWMVGIELLAVVIVKTIQLISIKVMRIKYKFVPLEDGELKDKINDLQKDCKKKVKHIYIYNESKKSTSKNAFLLKFMWYREFSIADNFMDGNSEEELLGVFAHEIGHLKHKKNIYEYMQYVFSIILGLVVIYVIDNVELIEGSINFINTAYGLRVTNYYLLLEVFSTLLKPFSFIDEIYGNYVSRINEYEADYNAVKCGYGKALINTFKRLSSDELVDVNPDPLYEFIEFDHPGMYNRIRYIEKKVEELKSEKNSTCESIS